MLHKLLAFGIEKGYFTLKKIKDLDKTCCPCCEIEVIDFDETKTIVAQEQLQQTIPSCDALKILPRIKRIDFIEMKSSENMRLEYSLRKNKDPQIFIEEKIKKLSLKDKLMESYDTLKNIIHKKAFKLTKQERVFFKEKVLKHYILLIDSELKTNGLKNLALNLDFLSTNSSDHPIRNELVSSLKTEMKENCEYLDFVPLLKSCGEIEDFYKEC